MAADTREPAASASSVAPTSTSASPQDNQTGTHAPVAPSNANTLAANAGLNIAGGKVQEASFIEGLRSIKPNDIKEVHKKPCVRDALLTGIGGGFGIGGARAIWGATVWSTCNWAVGSFVFGSLFMYEFCQRKRLLEKQGIKRAVEVIDQKHAEKQRKVEEGRAVRKGSN